MDWNKLIKKEYKAPYVPLIKHDADVNNFEEEFLETPIYSDPDLDSSNSKKSVE